MTFDTAVATTCPNCGAGMTGRRYCGECGQSRRSLDRSVWFLLGEALEELFGLEGRTFRTLRRLVRPGAVTADYLAGRRRAYTSPVRLYLASSAAFFLCFLLTRPIVRAYYGLPDTGGMASYTDAMARIAILMLPAAAVVLKVLYLRSRRPLVHHLVFSLYAGSAALLWQLLLMLVAAGLRAWLGHYTATPEWLPEYAIWLYGPGWLAFLGYVALALRRVYGSSLAGAVLRTVIAAAVLGWAFFAATIHLLRLLEA